MAWDSDNPPMGAAGVNREGLSGSKNLKAKYALVLLSQGIIQQVYSDWGLSSFFLHMLSHMVLQQQAPNKALITNRTPKTVKAILAQETSHQAKTITKTPSRIPQQHGDMIISFQLN